MSTRAVIIATIPLVLLIAAFGTAASVLSQATSYTPPPLDTSLLNDYTESAQVTWAGQEQEPPAGRGQPGLWLVDELPVVVARGDPQTMGRQYGKAVKELIKQAIKVYLLGKVVKDWGYPLDYQRKCAQSMLKHIPREYIEEMNGVAEAAGVAPEMVLLAHTQADMVHYGKSWGRPDSAPGKECSNFAVWGRWTTHGQLIHGRNLDWTTGTGVQQTACVYVGIPDQGIPFALVTHAGLVGGVTGMNAAGITFGEMTSSSSKETLDGLPLLFACRKILQYCRTIDDAEAFVKSYPRTTGWNFVIADGKVPTARAFEVDAEQVVVFKPGDPSENDPPLHWPMPDCVRRTNHYISREMQKKQAARYGIPYTAGRLALRSIDTWQRYACLSRWIKVNRGRIDARLARALLQTAPVGGDGNLHSVVMEPAAKRMWVANAAWDNGKAGPAWKQHYVFVDMSRFWPRG